MKKIAIKILFTSVVLGGLSLSGCTDLDEKPEGIISPVTFYKTEADFNAAINGAIQPWFSGYGAFDFNNALLLSGGAEDVTSRTTAPALKAYDEFNPDVNGSQAATEWRLLYKSINACNLIIANIDNATVSDEKKKGYEGQARYVRAMGYFYLTRWFGEIPLIRTLDEQRKAITIGQSPVANIYAAIIEDLQKAEEQLAASYPDKGRPTKGAAKALLAEVYLNMTGWPLKDVSKYALARDKAKEVMGMGYNLQPNFADLWRVQNKLTNPEFIFMFNGLSTETWVEGSHLHVASRPGEEGGWDDMMSEARFFNAFPAGPRKDASFHTVFNNAAKTTWQNSNVGQPYIAKYRDAGRAATFDGPVASTEGDGFFVMTRFAEVLLIYAEAANMAEGGPSADALEAINRVRRRAGGNDQAVYPDLQAGMSQANFDKAVIAERAWELAFENKRWFDLVRKEMVVEVNKELYPRVSAKNMLLPKPQKEVDLIEGLEQNPGY